MINKTWVIIFSQYLSLILAFIGASLTLQIYFLLNCNKVIMSYTGRYNLLNINHCDLLVLQRPKPWTEALQSLLWWLLMLNHWRSSSIFHFCVKTRMCHMCLSAPNRLWAEHAACHVRSSLPQSLLRRDLSSNHRFSLFRWLLRDSLCDFCCTVTSSPWRKRRNNSTWEFVLFLNVFFYLFFLNESGVSLSMAYIYSK